MAEQLKSHDAAAERLELRVLRESLSREIDAHLRSIFDALSYLGVFQKSYDERFSFPNALWRRWGFGPDEMHGNGWADALHPDDREFIMEEFDRQIRSRDYIELPEYRIVTKTGEIRWVLSKGVVVERNLDGVVTHYLGADFDVTARKSIEAEIDALLHERTGMLTESRHRIKNQLKVLDLRIESMQAQGSVAPDQLASIRSQLRSIQNINSAVMGVASGMRVDVGRLIGDIVQDTRHVFDPDERVSVTSHLQSVRVPSRVATVLAVGVQEALANAFTYGDRDNSPWIRIELIVESETVHLRVTNALAPAGPGNEHTADSGSGLSCLEEMVASENGTFEAGHLFSPDQWAVAIRVPFSAT